MLLNLYDHNKYLLFILISIPPYNTLIILNIHRNNILHKINFKFTLILIKLDFHLKLNVLIVNIKDYHFRENVTEQRCYFGQDVVVSG